MESIEKFALDINKYTNTSGNGSGYGYGYGYGSGSGYGSGYGDGYGNGNGYGSGSGYGSGYGDGYGYKLNNNKVFLIDSIPTIITKVKNNTAKGFIVNDDLSLTKTFVVKSENGEHFAHGESIKEALESLQDKLFDDLDTDKIIEAFLKDFDMNKKYTGKYFFDWHGRLTGSCKQGREAFVKNKNIDLDSEMNLEGFINLTENEYGGEIIKELKERLMKNEL